MNSEKEFKLKQLEQEIKDLTESSERLSSMEQAVKIVLNGGYGAIGTPTFRWYDLSIAEAITTTAQVAIRYITKKLNEFVVQEVEKYGGMTEFKDRVISSDTDSVLGNTIINTSIGKLSIEDLYNRYTCIENELKTNKDSVRKLNEKILSASYDNSKGIVYNNINYIMKHRVKKRMYKIIVGGKEVIVTEDHSIMVIRDDKLISTTPKNILKTDQFIQLED